MDCHNEAVTLLSEKVKEFYSQKNPFRIYHESTNATKRAKRSPDSSIDISGLDKVLGVQDAARDRLDAAMLLLIQ